MTKILILHGWEGSPQPHWQDWLSRELASDGFAVYFPQLPFAATPRKKVWLETLQECMELFSPDIVVCHSLGCILWLHYAHRHADSHPKKLLLVAPPSISTKIKAVDTFFPYPLPRLKADAALLVASTNDPYLTVEEAQKLSGSFGIELKLFENTGHINSASGFGPWPWALEWIRQ